MTEAKATHFPIKFVQLVSGPKVIVYHLADGSYLAGLDEDIGNQPELCVGCIGRWVNTDDLEFATTVYNALAFENAAGFRARKKTPSVTEAITWRDKLMERISQRLAL